MLELSKQCILACTERVMSMLPCTGLRVRDPDWPPPKHGWCCLALYAGVADCLLYTSDAADDTPCVDLG
eukprot:6255047-Amphidinium_carterae.1